MPPPQTSPLPEERRLVTVLFADIQGFTTLAETLDPEEVGDILNRVWTSLDAIVVQHGGRVDKHLGDALMAVWGAPSATEEDTERAVTCALALQRGLDSLNADFSRAGAPALHLRIGLNTGRVVTSFIGSTGEYAVIGDVVNVAQRLQSIAPIEGVAVGPLTYRMTRDSFRFESLQSQQLRGKTAPVECYRVLGPQEYPVRVHYRAAGSIDVHMIGRDAELARLRDVFSHTFATRKPHLALVTAEAGIGKSRLLFEFGRYLELDARRAPILSARALVENANLPFFLWESLWINRLNISKDEPEVSRREKFARGAIELWGGRLGPVPAVEAAHVLGYLIGLDWPDSPYLTPLRSDPSRLTAHAVELAAELFRRAAVTGPAVLLLDDLQHADASSMKLFDALLDQPDLPLMIVGATRLPPESLRPDWSRHENSVIVPLPPLTLNEDSIARIFPQASTLPAAFRRRLAARADGNPYFLEEMVKALLQTGLIISRNDHWHLTEERAPDSIPLPDSLRAQLQARLDALSPNTRAVAMAASVVGRTFWAGVLELLLRRITVTSLLPPPPNGNWSSPIAEALDELQKQELVFERVGGSTFVGEREFIFKNNLLRETAYSMLPRKYRQPYHVLVADWLAQRPAADYALAAAEHYADGGQSAKAIQYYRMAAENLKQRGYVNEARAALDAAARLEAAASKPADTLASMIHEGHEETRSKT